MGKTKSLKKDSSYVTPIPVKDLNETNGEAVNEYNPNAGQEQEQESEQPSETPSRFNCNCLKQKIASRVKWYKGLEKKRRIGLTVFAVFVIVGLLTAAIVIPIILTLPPPPQGIEMSSLSFNETQLLVNYAIAQKGTHTANAIAMGRSKVELSYPTVDSVTRLNWVSKDDLEILFSIPIFSILENFGNGHKQSEIYKSWLEDYNADPRKAVNKLIKMIRDKMSRTGTEKWGKKIADNLTLVSLTEVTYIDVLFDPVEGKFKAATFDPSFEDPAKIDYQSIENKKRRMGNNLRSDDSFKPSRDQARKDDVKKSQPQSGTTQADAPKNDTTKAADEATRKEKLMSRVMEQTIYYIKRVAARSVEFLREKSAGLLEYQKKIISENVVYQEWQQVLMDDCKALETLRFRCKISAAIKLDTDLTLEKISNAASEYAISQNLDIVFKEVKPASE